MRTWGSFWLYIQAVKFIAPQLRLAEKAGKQKKEYKLSLVSERTMNKIRDLTETPIEAVFTDPSYGKVHWVYIVCHILCKHLLF